MEKKAILPSNINDAQNLGRTRSFWSLMLIDVDSLLKCSLLIESGKMTKYHSANLAFLHRSNEREVRFVCREKSNDSADI